MTPSSKGNQRCLVSIRTKEISRRPLSTAEQNLIGYLGSHPGVSKFETYKDPRTVTDTEPSINPLVGSTTTWLMSRKVSHLERTPKFLNDRIDSVPVCL